MVCPLCLSCWLESNLNNTVVDSHSNCIEQTKNDLLVEQMLELHRQLAAARTPQEQTALERQIAATDTQIDRLVYDLYSLTEDEIKIVEGKTVAETSAAPAAEAPEAVAKPECIRKAKGLYCQPVATQPAAESEPAAPAFYNAMGKEEAPPYRTEGETP